MLLPSSRGLTGLMHRCGSCGQGHPHCVGATDCIIVSWSRQACADYEVLGIYQEDQWPGSVLGEVVRSPGGGRAVLLELWLATMLGWTCSVPSRQRLHQQAPAA